MSVHHKEILQKFDAIRDLIRDVEFDVQKHATGVRAAGTRSRAALRRLKALAADLVRASTAADKAAGAAKLAAKGGPSAPHENFLVENAPPATNPAAVAARKKLARGGITAP